MKLLNFIQACALSVSVYAQPPDPDSPFTFGEYYFKDVEGIAEAVKPVDFAKEASLAAQESEKNEPCAGARVFMLYSSWCPHCHAFAPRWLELAALLRKCKAKRPLLASFECASNNETRLSSQSDWKKSGLNKKGANLPETPRDACAYFLAEAYPTIGAFVDPKCKLVGPAQHIPLEPESMNGIEWFNKTKLSYYRVPVGALGKSAGSAYEALHKSGLFPECDNVLSLSGNLTEQDRKHVQKVIDSLPASNAVETSSRWPSEAQLVNSNVKMHDAILGVYFIIREWIVPNSESLTLSQDQLAATRNFLFLLNKLLPGGKTEKEKLRAFSEFLEGKNSVTLDELRSTLKVNDVEAFKLYGVDDIKESSSTLRHEISLTCHSPLCLVWTLMHLLTQSLYDRMGSMKASHSPVTLVQLESKTTEFTPNKLDDQTALPHPRTIPTILHQIVMSYFNCESCREHFHAAYEAGAAEMYEWTTGGSLPQTTLEIEEDMDLRSAMGTVLWFWRFHNIVDIRTALDAVISNVRQQIALDKKRREIKLLYDGEDVRYPTRLMCPSCYLKDAQSSFFMSKKMVDSFLFVKEDESQMRYDRYEEFDLQKVLETLHKVYSLSHLDSKQKSDQDHIAWNANRAEFQLTKASNKDDQQRLLRTGNAGSFPTFRTAAPYSPPFLRTGALNSPMV